jgi:hypothetical protein
MFYGTSRDLNGGGLRLAVKPRPRGLASWSPQKKTLDLVQQVRVVLAEYAAYLPLTIRQIFYRLVGAHDYPKTEQAYERLGEMLNRARRGRFIDFKNIRDDDADLKTQVGYNSGNRLVENWQVEAKYFRLNRQLGQPTRLLILVEARGMKPQVEAVAHRWSVPVLGSGGFDSLTWKHDIAAILGNRDVSTEILHIGDYDPSGVHLFASMAEDVQALIQDLRLDVPVSFTRLAVTREQIDALGLPTAPPKATDRRAFDDNDTVQAEAIAPSTMAQIVTQAVTGRIDPAIYQQTLASEKVIRDRLVAALRGIRFDEGGAQ